MILYNESYIDLARGNWPVALGKMETSKLVARAGNERYREGHRTRGLGLVELLRGCPAAAANHARAALDIFRSIEHRGGRAMAHLLLGEALHHIGDHAQALHHYERVCALENPATAFRAWILRGILLKNEGRAPEGQECLQRGLSLCRELIDATPTYVDAVYTMALGVLASERMDEALERYRSALLVCDAHGILVGVGLDLMLLESGQGRAGNALPVRALLRGKT